MNPLLVQPGPGTRRIEDILIVGTGVVCFDVAFRTVDNPPTGNKLVRTDNVRAAIGGPAAAALLAMVKLGGQARFVGPMAVDMLGRVICAMLRDHDIDTEHMWADETSCAPASALLIGSGGTRGIIHCPGSNSGLNEAGFRYDALTGANGFLLAGPGICDGLHGQPGATLLQKVRALGIKTAVDTISAGLPSTGEAFWMIEPWLPYIDYLFISMNEAGQYTGKDTAEQVAEYLIAKGSRLVFVKRGAQGMLIAMGGQPAVEVAGFSVTAVDKTGSGDCTVAATYARLLQGFSPFDAARFGNAVGATVVREGQGANGVPKVGKVLADFGLAF